VAGVTRPLRADARRNRDRVVAVAQEVFAEHGAGASLDEVARRAGVGAGTLYRHFPNRAALQEAVYRGAVEELGELGRTLMDTRDPTAALEGWMRLLVGHMVARRGLAEALVDALGKGSEVFADCHRVLHETGGALVERARAAGVVRDDLDQRDLLWMAHGVALAAESEGGDARVERLLNILIAGMTGQAAP
jgi:AcrR family transcriptional regulator